MKKIAIPLSLILFYMTGCAGGRITHMEGNTYMVERGGWPHMNEYALETKCMADADKFCQKRGLEMKVISTDGVNGQDFGHNASFKLIFQAVQTNNLNQISK